MLHRQIYYALFISYVHLKFSFFSQMSYSYLQKSKKESKTITWHNSILISNTISFFPSECCLHTEMHVLDLIQSMMWSVLADLNSQKVFLTIKAEDYSVLGAWNGISTGLSSKEKVSGNYLQEEVVKTWIAATSWGRSIAFVLMSSIYERCHRRRRLPCSCPLGGNSHLSPAKWNQMDYLISICSRKRIFFFKENDRYE